MSCVIRLHQVKKYFPRYPNRVSAFATLKRLILQKDSPNGHYVPALQEINLEILKGQRVAIIGNNGAGKTTLLKLIAGLYAPTSGTVSVCGEITLVAGLAIGMMDELSVEENVRLYGMIYGMDRKEVDQKLPEILEWSELAAFRESPLKTLSTGMKARLAFSATRHFQTDIYLLDEVLAAGDKNFKIKCETVFEEYKKSDKTFVISTHDLKFAENFCDQALWLHHGSAMAYGSSGEVVAQYSKHR
jgi:ABC-type polysaccharide/polyol phosphate transport system ATPase subunit